MRNLLLLLFFLLLLIPTSDAQMVCDRWGNCYPTYTAPVRSTVQAAVATPVRIVNRVAAPVVTYSSGPAVTYQNQTYYSRGLFGRLRRHTRTVAVPVSSSYQSGYRASGGSYGGTSAATSLTGSNPYVARKPTAKAETPATCPHCGEPLTTTSREANPVAKAPTPPTVRYAPEPPPAMLARRYAPAPPRVARSAPLPPPNRVAAYGRSTSQQVAVRNRTAARNT